MILSGKTALSPTDHVATTAELRDRLEDLDVRRRRADRSIETMLATWRGDAADAFRARWEEWSTATACVVDELSATAQALDLARLDLASADSSSGRSSERLAGRLASPMRWTSTSSAADDSYSRAVRTNVALWRQVSA